MFVHVIYDETISNHDMLKRPSQPVGGNRAAAVVCAVLLGIACPALFAEELNGPAVAEPAQPAVDFAGEIFPILQRSCIECHGPNKEEEGAASRAS